MNEDWFDVGQCKTIRKDDSDGQATASCPSGSYATSAGSWCGNGGHIRGTDLWYSSAKTTCTSTPVHAYAICCDNLQP